MRDSPALPPGNWPDFRPGEVWICGAGPGDPGLLTLHGLNALAQADVVVHDALVPDAILALSRPGAERVAAGKRAGRPSARQEAITDELATLARAGRRVLRLKGGDPYLFGRSAEEALALVAQGVAVRVIPGVPAAVGGLAAAGIPLTHRDVNGAVTFLTGHAAGGGLPAHDWPALARGGGVLVIHMGLRRLAEIAERLMAGGRPGGEPVAIVFSASLPEQAVVETTLAEAGEAARAAPRDGPALVVVGGTVSFRGALAAAGLGA